MMKKKLIFMFFLFGGCQSATELPVDVVNATKPGSSSGQPKVEAEVEPKTEMGLVPTPSLLIEGNCAEFLKPDVCEWANTSDNQLYFRIRSVNAVTDDVVTIRQSAESNETEWVNMGFEQCERPRIALEIEVEVLWSWLPIPSNEVSVIIGPSTLLAFGLYAEWDTDKAEIAWYNDDARLVPGMEFGAGVAQHPNKENAFVLNWMPLFDDQNGKTSFHEGNEVGCVEVPPSLKGLAYSSFKQDMKACAFVPGSAFRAGQAKGMTGPALYTTSCNDAVKAPNSCTADIECFSGYVCKDSQCVCHPDAPNCP